MIIEFFPMDFGLNLRSYRSDKMRDDYLTTGLTLNDLR